MINHIKITWSIFSVLFFYTLGYASADPAENPKSIFEMMEVDKVLELRIDADLDSIIAQRRSAEGLVTSVSFKGKNGKLQEWEAKLSARGKFRRVHCEVPPLKLDFKKGDLREQGLAEFDDFKLVTHCVPDPTEAKELVLREYLIYKLYNELTDYSFRVQLTRITYRNPYTGKEDEQWGFLIEDTAELSARIGMEEVESFSFPIDSFHREHLQKLTVFQKMIGNPDWGINPTKNVKYFRKDGKLIPIAYDFDFAALVDASYARATVKLQQMQGVRNQYVILEPHVFGEDIHPTLEYFQSKQEDLVATVQKVKNLSSRKRKEVIQFLDRNLENSKLLAKTDLVDME